MGFAMRKLVRDRIPEIIDNNGKGEKSRWHRIDKDEEYLERLLDKLLEETHEVAGHITPEARLLECADVVEVVRALLVLQGVNRQQFMQVLRDRRRERGGFEKRVFLDSVESPTIRPDGVGYHIFK
jgi:predicted house-cleaning noncanonical NTP pyrophosphatase (MazG superfamily)